MRIGFSASLVLMTLSASAALVGQSAAPGDPSSRQRAGRQVTFAEDVAPILQSRCQTCHRPGTVAPMSLLTYEEARPWAKAIKQKVAMREMPPWFIDKNIGIQRFKNDISLSDDEIATIVAWADSGAPLGNPADMPPPRVFPAIETWQIGQPDLVISMPTDVIVPATGPDRWPDVLADPGLTEDRYIQGVQIIPTKGYPVIHHIRTGLVAPTDPTRRGGSTDGFDGPPAGEQGVFLNEYAIGKQGDVFQQGSGRLIKAGTKISFSLHLHPYGQETSANVALALKFYPKGYVPQHIVVSMTGVDAGELDIPPNTDNVRADSYVTLSKPARLLSFQPHMHNRGKAMCLEAIYPGPKVEMLSCARFKFNWHLNYVYDDNAAPLLPAGTVLHAISWHDNTTANKMNNDPDALITWGNRTIDEMQEPWLSWYYMSEEEYKQEVEARKAKPELSTGSR